jgi:uncharacterized membrane protein affecting hemolysin expression
VADDDLRQFMHELLARFERRTQAMERRLDLGTEALRENTRVMHASIEDMRADIRANTQAILHVLDELRGPRPGPEPA